MIDSYSFGSITIDGKEYSHDVVVSGSNVKFWRRATSHEVTINDLAPILEEKPKLIVFGTGASGIMKVMPETEEYLNQQGIKFEIMMTGEATSEFNRLSAEPGVVGAFHLTC
ncbi:MAG: Mth938-like domain-containing protein [Candidatus Margulisiibacteriota bacterium]